MPHCDYFVKRRAGVHPSFIHRHRSLLADDLGSRCVGITSREDAVVKQGYRLIIAVKPGVLVSEFQPTDRDLADSAAFVAALKQSIEEAVL